MSRLTRRRLVGGVAVVSLASAALYARQRLAAQPTPWPARIGVLLSGSMASARPSVDAFVAGLHDLGYTEHQTYTLEIRAADGSAERLPALATELVQANVAVILTGGREAIRAARAATTTVPIVFASTSDPVAEGFVESLVHPGGNTTGLTLEAGEEDARRVQLLRDAAPTMRRPAIVWTERVTREFKKAEAAATEFGLEVASLRLDDPAQIDKLLESPTAQAADGLIVIADALFMPLAQRIVGFAARTRIPAIYPTSTYAQVGGLLTYGASIPGNYRRAAAYVDKILRGTRPADLPVERPSTYDFIINLKTAQAIGLTLPESVLVQATEIVR